MTVTAPGKRRHHYDVIDDHRVTRAAMASPTANVDMYK